MTTDVAAIPLLWVLPLALYLLTFIVVFSRLGPAVLPAALKLMPMVTVLVLGKLLTEMTMPLFLELTLHLTAFFVIALVCHGELARTRPGARHLTEFYLLMSLGGVLGGLFNALVAPVAFSRGLEYPVVLVLACLLMPPAAAAGARFVRADALVALAAALLVAAYHGLWAWASVGALAERVGDGAAVAVRLLTIFPALALVYVASSRPLRLALAAAVALAVGMTLDDPEGRVLCRDRGFFGQMAVRYDPENNAHWLVHGTTLHGMQALGEGQRQEPLTYFHRSGPMGQVFALPAASRKHIGITGLGMGSLACYARPGQEWAFYEIDPVVARVAEDERYFTCLADARRRGARVEVLLGDARLRLVEAPANGYDLLVLDSFSSDSVPMHLISHEALKLYLSKLAPGGVLCFNISNRYLDLEPVLARQAAEEGLTALTRYDTTGLDRHPGKRPSRWVVMSRSAEALAPLARGGDWQTAQTKAGVGLWRDDFGDLLSVFSWRER